MDKPRKSVGHIKNVKIKSESPKLNINMSIGEILILIGKNRTGKTFILVMQYIANSYLMAHLSGQVMPTSNELMLQHLVDGSLDIKDLEGEFEFTYEHCTFSFKATNGKVSDISIITDSTVDLVGTPVIYLSSGARLFQPFKTYMILKEGLKKANMNEEQIFTELFKAYKHYDMTFYELVLANLDKPYILEDELQKTLKDNYDLEDTIISLEKVDNDIIVTRESGTKHSVSTFGSGHQSIMTMMVFTKIIQRSRDGR